MGKIRKLKCGGEPFFYSTELPASDEKVIWERLDLQPNKHIQKIYKEGAVVVGKDKIKLTSAISPAEGFHLYDLIVRNKYTNILEVGLANGLSSLYILQALKDNGMNGQLTSIDPFQSTQWKSAGLFNIKNAGLDKNHTLIEKKSYVTLPELLATSDTKFDLIFIDGMHLFDYTLIDVFYSILLCKIGGVIVIDDILHKAPAKVVKYMDTNYKFMRRINPLPVKTVATYLKTGEDTRNWDHFAGF
jgi:predicted O-methyltransferase YrrM